MTYVYIVGGIIIWEIIGMLVANFSYRDRQATSCIEGGIAVIIWPLLLVREIIFHSQKI